LDGNKQIQAFLLEIVLFPCHNVVKVQNHLEVKMTTIPKLMGILVMLSFLIAACSLTSFSSQRESIPVTGAESAPNSQEEISEPQLEQDEILVSCFDVNALTLQADHTLTVDELDTHLTHMLKHGGLL
jgi:hypothetical protein